FQRYCWYPRSSIKEHKGYPGDQYHFEKFIGALVADLQKRAIPNHERALVYADVFSQLPRVMVTGGDVQACVEHILQKWESPLLGRAFCAMCAANLDIGEVRSL